MKKQLSLIVLALLGAGISLFAASSDDPAEQEMLVIGETEFLFITEADCVFDSRIDTGATTCSIHALDIEEFERDGEAWVSFKLVNPSNDQTVELEKEVARVVRVTRREGEAAQKRYIVPLDATIGDRTMTLEFSLTDRTDFEYPLLVGRNLLRGLAVVDVSQAYTEGKKPRPQKK